MKLSRILRGLDVHRVIGSSDPEISRVTRDSREVGEDSVFVAIVGGSVDGHRFVPGLGAAVVVVERPLDTDVVQVVVPDTRVALARIAAALHGEPGKDLRVIGVTGTNGKTTVTTLAQQALESAGLRVGRVGTTGHTVAGKERASRFTTPEAPALQALLAEMRDAGAAAALLEVSSIGLVQRRVDALPFHLGVFTNFTRDHLDFHGTMEDYLAAKAMLFQRLRPVGGWPRALLCADDPAHDAMNAPQDRWTYGHASSADLRVESAKMDASGSVLGVATPLGSVEIRSPLVGRHNADNLIAALGIALCLDVPLEAAAAAVGSATGAPGRLEVVPNDKGLLVLVDYAHSDDALATVIPVVSELVSGLTWVVFGAGGDRDRGKRPRMGAVAERLADRVVVTSDNPRSEDPQAILDAIVGGLTDAPARVEVDRKRAIEWTLNAAGPGDAVLIAGKGHETYQEVGAVRLPFDDRAVAAAALEAL